MGKRLADFIVLHHAIIIFTLIVGVPVAYCYTPFWAWIELVLVSGVMLSWPIFGGCPLTALENWLRAKSHPQGVYEGPCISHYTRKFFKVEVPAWVINVAGVLILAVSVWTLVFRRGST